MTKCTDQLCLYGKKLTQGRDLIERDEGGIFEEPPARGEGGPSSSSASGNLIEPNFGGNSPKEKRREPSPR
eukprot:6962385-Karenia_brevis.AAC.1